MRIESLNYFLEIVKWGSFTRAAENLYVSQQGLSRAIKALEGDLDVMLFRRSDKHISLTEEGRSIVPYAQAIVERERDMRRALSQYRLETPQDGHEMDFSVMPFVTNVVFRLMKDEMKRWDINDASFFERDLRETLMMMEAGTLKDPAFVVILSNEVPCLLSSGNISFKPFLSMDLVAICPRNLISPRRHVLSMKELSALPVAYYKDATINRTIEYLSHGEGLKNVVLSSSSIDIINEAVANGRACALTDSFSAYLQTRDDDSSVLAIKQSISVMFGFLYLTSRPPSDLQQAYMKRFEQMLNEECRSYINRYPAKLPPPRFQLP